MSRSFLTINSTGMYTTSIDTLTATADGFICWRKNSNHSSNN